MPSLILEVEEEVLETKGEAEEEGVLAEEETKLSASFAKSQGILLPNVGTDLSRTILLLKCSSEEIHHSSHTTPIPLLI